MAAPAAPARRRRALLVATATYSDAGLAALRAPVGDVQALAGVLRDRSICGFEVTELIDRPTEEIKREIEGFFDDARREDLLLLYFSGHGVLSRSRRFYFATTTTALQWLRATAIDDAFVNDVMQQSRARSIVLMLDCCHSGAFGKGLAPKGPLTVDVEHRFEGRGRITLSASTELEYAFEETEPATGINPLSTAAPGSLFTRAVVEGLATGDADLDADGRISVDELYDYLYQRMRDGPAHQTPGIAGDMRGDIVIARSRRVAEPPPPPPPRAPSHPAPPPPAAPRHRPGTRVIVAVASAGAAAIAAVTILLAGDGPGGGLARSGGPLAYDLDGDGAQEIAIAPVNAKSPEVVVHSGSASARPVVISAGEAGLTDAVTDSLFGSGLASADFNGDDHADLAIGTPGLNRVAVLYGTSDGLKRHGPPIGSDSPPAHQYGYSLAAGDLNGDEFDDLAVGAAGAGEEDGAVQIVFGSEDGLRTGGARTIEAPGRVIGFGERLAIGDVDGDGHADLVEGTPSIHSVPGGHLTFCRGAADGPGSCRELPPKDQDAGTSALAVADVDGDGRDDIVQANAQLGYGSGYVRLWLGAKGGPPGTPQELVPDTVEPDDDDLESPDAEFGASMDVGRLDGDDYADIVVGIPGYKHGDGAVAVIRGGPNGFADAGHRVLPRRPEGEGHRFGSDVALLRLTDDTPTIVVAAEDADLDAAVLVAGDNGIATPVPGLGRRVVQGDATGLRLGR